MLNGHCWRSALIDDRFDRSLSLGLAEIPMAYQARVFRILIASPSDVIEEREIAVRTIQEWNDLNSGERRIVLLPQTE